MRCCGVRAEAAHCSPCPQSADEQDAGLVAAVAEGRVDLGDMKLEEVMLIRRQGRDRMNAIVELATGMAK